MTPWTCLEVGEGQVDNAVKSPGPREGGVQRAGPVGGRHDDDARVVLKAVHLRQQLVDGLHALCGAMHSDFISNAEMLANMLPCCLCIANVSPQSPCV